MSIARQGKVLSDDFKLFSLTYNQVLFGRQGAPRRRWFGFIRQVQVDVDGMGECFRHVQVARNGMSLGWYWLVLLRRGAVGCSGPKSVKSRDI